MSVRGDCISEANSSGPAEAPVRGLHVAIMQPYFVPYAGYFRLFAATDLFVLYDCVQFPRRGWLHRNQLRDTRGESQWLTLPLRKAPQDVLIHDLRFRDTAAADMDGQFPRFPALALAAALPLMQQFRDLSGTPLDHIERLLRYAAEQLGLPWRVLRSSSLGVDPALRGQDRILAIAGRLGAACYVNAPGGRALYDTASFNAAGIALRFLEPHLGSYASIAERLATEPPAAIAAEIVAGSRLVA
ncbi:MAG: WbqC family protein [Proteobacteria bacterium]|nr:WbqC family protein [Pseudomonadota bacterium]